LLDFSNRQSKQNIIQNANPYVFEVSSAKKTKIKKKSDSVDFVSSNIANTYYFPIVEAKEAEDLKELIELQQSKHNHDATQQKSHG
jgi:hypothetical protein